jgi:hypothetical protein
MQNIPFTLHIVGEFHCGICPLSALVLAYSEGV